MIKEDKDGVEEEALELLGYVVEGFNEIDPKFFTLKEADEVSINDRKRTEVILSFLCDRGLVGVVKDDENGKIFEVTREGLRAYYLSLESLGDSWDKGGESG